jgi:hypothetical protein
MPSTVRERLARIPELGPRSAAIGPVRSSWILHLLGLAVVAAVLVLLARGQWFFYDEWDLLDDAREWALLGSHNGHLSLGLALVTTVLKKFVGLHSYWPYLLVTIAVHLALVHLLWRLLWRSGAHAVVALLLPLVFGVLGAGAENIFWAFQTGFIAPLAFGVGAVLIVDRAVLDRRSLVAVILLLAAGLSFASTAIPVIGAVLLLVLARHGWRPAAVIAAVIGVPYLAWRVAFASGGGDGYGVANLGNLLVGVPDYVVRGLVDSIAKVGPFAPIAGALFLLIAVCVIWTATRGRARTLPVAYFLAAGGLVFSVLTAFSRVNLGPESASAGRYVYVYAALFLPIIAIGASWVARRGWVGYAAAGLVMLMLGGYNALTLAGAARDQAALEQTTRAMVNAAIVYGQEHEVDPDARPLPILAPTLSFAELERFVESGEIEVGPVDDAAALSVAVNLELRSEPEPSAVCSSGPVDTLVLEPSASRGVVVAEGAAGSYTVVVSEGWVVSSYTRVDLVEGGQQLVGFDDARIVITAPEPVLCAAEPDPAR